LLIDKIRWAEDINLTVTVPEDYLEKLTKNIPESLLPLISDCVRVFLKHIDAPEEEIERISEKIYQRRLNEMFQMVDGYSVKKTREQVRAEAKEENRKETLEIAKSLLDVLDIKTIAKKFKLTSDELKLLQSEQ